jgi:putative ABC transport system permease protein
MERLVQDLKFAVRVLWKSRRFTLIAVATMGLAIGATTAMFSIVESTLLRQLPFEEPQRLMMVYLTRSENGGAPSRLRWAYLRYRLLQDSAKSFESLATFGRSNLNITGVDQPLRVNGETVSANYFQVLRQRVLIGRTFLAEEDERPGEKAVAVIGFGMWKRLFGGVPDVIGKTIGINQLPFTIIGVMPEDFSGLTGGAEVWVPNMMAPVIAYPQHLTSMQNFINVVGRLKEDATVADAQSELALIGKRIVEAYPADAADRGVWGATALPLDRMRIDPARRRSQIILIGAVGFLLLIACVNTASLLLSRAASREREMAMRRALGSTRLRLVRQLLTESVLLAASGGALGLLLAWWSMDTLSALIPPLLPSPANDYAQLSDFAAIRINGTVFVFATVISVLTGILFGLAPAIYASGSPGPVQRTRKFRPFVVTEFALALILLIGAALLIESFFKLQRVDVGFDPEHVLTFYIQPPQQEYDGKKGPALLEQILQRVTAVPGVESATVSLCTPLMSTCARTSVLPVGQQTPPFSAGRHYVGPDHFKTLGITLLEGRGFTHADRIGAPSVAIVNQTAARKLWPNESAIGKRVRLGSNPPFDTDENDSLEVVGMVRDVKYGTLEDEAVMDVYTPYMQFSWWFSYVMVRTSRPSESIVPEMRRAVAAVDPNLPIDSVLTMEERIGIVQQRPRFSLILLSIFAGLALILAAVGIYGVTAHAVAARTREIGIRMALGADPQALSRWILREGLILIGVGVALGTAGSLGLTRLLQSQLYEVQATNVFTLTVTALVLSGVGATACYLPARRATRVDPLLALRSE